MADTPTVDWLACPSCEEPVHPPSSYEDGEPFYWEADGECPACWALWRVEADDDEARMTWDEEHADHGQPKCDGTCPGGACFAWVAEQHPCSRDCPRSAKSEVAP